MLIFIYYGYRSHSTEPLDRRSEKYHREKVNQEKEAWQQKQIQVKIMWIVDDNIQCIFI